jgi:hypothetical protein
MKMRSGCVREGGWKMFGIGGLEEDMVVSMRERYFGVLGFWNWVGCER